MQGWNWPGFFDYLTNGYLLAGAFTTLWLTAFSIVAGLMIGFALALMRQSRSRLLSTPAAAYVWLFRGTPLLVQLIIIYTGLPQFGIKLSVVSSALLGLSLNEAAYLAEVVRAGIAAVSRGQINAARALGMRERQVMRDIVMPQAFRIIIPPLGNSVNGMLKTTSITSVISMEELMRRSQLLMQQKFEVLELYTVAAVYYLTLTTLWNLVQVRLEAYYGRGYGETGGRPAPSRPLTPVADRV